VHAPWIQVANELLDQVAPDVGVQLDIDEVAVIGHLNLLVRWALGRCLDSQPPSFNDVVKGANAARLVAAGARFKGDPEQLVTALCECTPALLERVPEGIRVRGLDRYDALWGKNHAEEWRRLKETGAYPARNRPETVPEPVPDRPPDADADADPKKKTSSAEPTDEAVEKLWESICFRRTQDRQLALEPTKPKKFAAVMKAALADGYTDRELQTSHAAYLCDDDFRLKGWPTSLWLSDNIWRPRARIPRPARLAAAR
jgi:hypothetical protein